MAKFDFSESIEACAERYGEDADAVRTYMNEGLEAALALPNRGPIKFNADGSLDQAIVDAYSQYGFYIFEGAIGAQELADIEDDLDDLRGRFPTHPGSEVDMHGRPALGTDCKGPGLTWGKPLGDPLGGTALANGRHQIKLKELDAGEGAPEATPFILLGSLQFSDAAMRTYGHPELLQVAECINGADFAPFTEVLFIKDPGYGAAVSWHQDGDTHWDNPEFDEDIHGFNFMAQAYGSTPVNGVWVVPGTHKLGKMDIPQMVEESGSERLKDAVPIVCEAGDVVMCNRQLVHGSFANSGFEPRLTINFGFHKRSSVLNVEGAGIHCPVETYSADVIRERSKVIGYAIDARKQKYPDEQPYSYAPFAEAEEDFAWTPESKASLKDYNLIDLSI